MIFVEMNSISENKNKNKKRTIVHVWHFFFFGKI